MESFNRVLRKMLYKSKDMYTDSSYEVSFLSSSEKNGGSAKEIYNQTEDREMGISKDSLASRQKEGKRREEKSDEALWSALTSTFPRPSF
mmetsp:Transcript_12888/g.25194  ORF Transcript_12888/g.25194 Transcript_12888/m.25194 type:complete len:90 (-) Transcript_12888:319-588(-)